MADPENPKLVATVPSASGSRAVAVSGNHVFANAGNLFQVIDPANAAAPRVIGQTEIAGDISSIAIKQNIAYVTAGHAGLHLIDIQNPTDPRRIGGLSTNQQLGPVLVAGDLAFVGAQQGFFTFDVSDPRNPRELSFTERAISVRDWAVSDGKLYAMSGSELVAYDISGPTTLRREHVVSLKQEMQALSIERGIAYLGGFDEMEAISLTSAANPQSITTVAETGLWQADVDIRGSVGYVVDESDGLHIIDLSEEEGPRLYATFTNQNSLAATVGGEFAYIADWRRGITVVDVRDAANPVQAGFYASGRSQDVFLDGTHLYVANFTNDLLILDISSPAQPTFLSRLALPGLAVGVVVSDERAYVSGGERRSPRC